jgi:hypothetical protein
MTDHRKISLESINPCKLGFSFFTHTSLVVNEKADSYDMPVSSVSLDIMIGNSDVLCIKDVSDPMGTEFCVSDRTFGKKIWLTGIYRSVRSNDI